MGQYANLTSGMIRVSALSADSLRSVLAAGEAERCLLDYRSPGAEVTREEFFAMLDMIRAGKSPADAAELVQSQSH